MAMSLPLVPSAVFLIAKYFLVKCGRLEGISEMTLPPLRGLSVSGMYEFMYVLKGRNVIVLSE
jgi:hypothetical protein